MKQDEILRELNSSAAECAHGTIRRIQKSLSYMNEENTILFMDVMILMWNRRKIVKIHTLQAKGIIVN